MHVFAFQFFIHFFQGGQLTPCADAHAYSLIINSVLLFWFWPTLHVPMRPRSHWSSVQFMCRERAFSRRACCCSSPVALRAHSGARSTRRRCPDEARSGASDAASTRTPSPGSPPRTDRRHRRRGPSSRRPLPQQPRLGVLAGHWTGRLQAGDEAAVDVGQRLRQQTKQRHPLTY